MKKKAFVFWAFFLVAVLLTLFSFVLLYLFPIKTVIVVSEYSVIYGLELVNGQNIFFVNTDQIRQNLIKRNPGLSSVSIVKNYPSTLVVNLHFREPVALVLGSSVQLYIDRNGVFLPFFKKNLILPTIDASNIAFAADHKADWRIIKAIAFLEDISKQGLFVERIFIDDETKMFLIYLTEGSQVIAPYVSTTSKIAASLQAIIARFRIEGKFVKKIDFRFDKPVVTFSNGEKISSL